MATLLLEGRELSHKEISNLTGYSISSVSRTLDQMIRMGISHKHKDASIKHFVLHTSVGFPEMIASSMETILRIYVATRDEFKKLTRKAESLKSKEKEKAEINRSHTIGKRRENIEFAEGIMKNTIKKMRLHPRESQ